MPCGALYHQGLAAGLVKLGLAVEVTGKDGLFEMAGVDPALCSYFSVRHHEIETELAAIGLATEQILEQARAVGRARALSHDPVSSDPASPGRRPSRAVLEALTKRDSLVEYRQLVAALAAAHVGSDTVFSVEAEVAQLCADGAVVALGHDR